MARLVTPSANALATELEAQRVIWKVSALAPADMGHSEEEQDLVCMLLNAVSDAVERLLGGVIERTYTERYDGGTAWIALRHRPVWSVASVKELNAQLAEGTHYLVYRESGRIRRIPWLPGHTVFAPYPQAIEVTYVAGWATQIRDPNNQLIAVNYRPGGEAIRQAVLLWCKALWEVGPAAYSYQITESGVFLNRNLEVPPPVAALLAPFRNATARIAP